MHMYVLYIYMEIASCSADMFLIPTDLDGTCLFASISYYFEIYSGNTAMELRNIEEYHSNAIKRCPFSILLVTVYTH